MTDLYNEKDVKSAALLLTGTIKPKIQNINEDVLLERIKSYESSIERYITQSVFNPIVFVDNSEYEFDNDKYQKLAAEHGKCFEYIQGTCCDDEVRIHGKGYGDALLIYEGVIKSKLLSQYNYFYKATGRIFIKNTSKLIKGANRYRNQFITYDGMGWCMTWFFKMNRKDFLSWFADIYMECDDRTLCDIEICYWKRIKLSSIEVGSFPTYPYVEGNIGFTKIPYNSGRLNWLIRFFLIKTGVFTCGSKISNLFWRTYIKMSGRTPYTTVENIKNQYINR